MWPRIKMTYDTIIPRMAARKKNLKRFSNCKRNKTLIVLFSVATYTAYTCKYKKKLIRRGLFLKNMSIKTNSANTMNSPLYQCIHIADEIAYSKRQANNFCDTSSKYCEEWIKQSRERFPKRWVDQFKAPNVHTKRSMPHCDVWNDTVHPFPYNVTKHSNPLMDGWRGVLIFFGCKKEWPYLSIILKRLFHSIY